MTANRYKERTVDPMDQQFRIEQAESERLLEVLDAGIDSLEAKR